MKILVGQPPHESGVKQINNEIIKNREVDIVLYPEGYLEHVALRDYLRTSRDAREDYAALKTKLAKEYRYDADTYCERKTKFIQKILNSTLYFNKS